MSRNIKRLPEEGPFYRGTGLSLCAARRATGKTQEDVADCLGVSTQQVQKYENGKDRIPLYALVRFADYLELPLSQFIAPSAGDAEFQSLALKFTGKEFHDLMQAFGNIKDGPARSALLNMAKCMANITR